MGWLFAPVFLSVIGGLLAVRALSLVLGEATSGIASAAKAGTFVAASTAIIASMGMSGFKKRVRKLRSLTRVSGNSKKR